jgi:hypothetical protein
VNRSVPALLLAAWLGLAGALVGCSTSDTGAIQIITDEEAGTFTASPALTELRVVAESADASTVLATAQLPTSTIDLGQLSETSSVVSIAIEGFDSSNTQRAFGATLPVEYAALAGQTISVFVQRDGTLARLPGPLTDARQAPTLAVLQGEYLLITGGSGTPDAKTTQLYDFGFFTAVGAPPTLPIAPQSIALAGTVAWLVDDTTGWYFDFSSDPSSASVPLAPPAGGTFADVAGGATVIDANGAQYIVGATRLTGPPTDKVLKVDPNDGSNSAYPYGNTTWITLSAPRLGAAAAWTTSYGLVVAGGSNTAAGVESVLPGAATGAPLNQFPPDPAFGAGAAALDGTHVLVAGGGTGLFEDPGVRDLDLGCAGASASCATVVSWGHLPVVVSPAQTFALGTSDGLVVANEFGSGATHVFRLSPTSITEVPTRTPHTNARAAWSPVGSIVLFGGANVIESFTP